MSSTTDSLTLVVPIPEAATALARLRAGRYIDGTALDLVADPVADLLAVDGRHDNLERNLRAYLQAFEAQGVEHFHAASQILSDRPWGVVLHAGDIARAIDGLGAFLEALRASPERAAALWNQPGLVCAGGDFDASIFDEEWPQDSRSANPWAHDLIHDADGMDFYCIPVFFHAHRLLLMRALATGQAVVYAIENN